MIFIYLRHLNDYFNDNIIFKCVILFETFVILPINYICIIVFELESFYVTYFFLKKKRRQLFLIFY